MEHILQFAISIDDQGIKDSIEESARNKLSTELKNEVKNKIIRDNGWGSSTFTDAGEKIIKDVMEQYKDDIIQKAAELVADAIKKSKKYREALADIVEEMK